MSPYPGPEQARKKRLHWSTEEKGRVATVSNIVVECLSKEK